MKELYPRQFVEYVFLCYLQGTTHGFASFKKRKTALAGQRPWASLQVFRHKLIWNKLHLYRFDIDTHWHIPYIHIRESDFQLYIPCEVLFSSKSFWLQLDTGKRRNTRPRLKRKLKEDLDRQVADYKLQKESAANCIAEDVSFMDHYDCGCGPCTTLESTLQFRRSH